MAREARARAGAATCGQETGRGRVRGVVGWRGRVLVVGSVSGGCVPAGVARCSACTQGARQRVGLRCNDECGQGRGPWCEWSTRGGSGRQGQAPGHAGSLLCCWLVASGHGGGMLCHGCLRARVSGMGVWGVSRGCRGHWVRCWTCWFGKWASG